MRNDPWTDPDPQPGVFDAELERARPGDVQVHDGNPDATLTILVSVEGDDAKRLEQLAAVHHQKPGEVVSGLLRSVQPE